jgi:DNA repair exonuclease SbcCD ATPase subunit
VEGLPKQELTTDSAHDEGTFETNEIAADADDEEDDEQIEVSTAVDAPLKPVSTKRSIDDDSDDRIDGSRSPSPAIKRCKTDVSELLKKNLDTKTIRKDELGALKDELAAVGTLLAKIETNASRSIVAADLHAYEVDTAIRALRNDRDDYEASSREWQFKHAVINTALTNMATTRDEWRAEAEQLALDKTDLDDKLHEARSEGVRIDEEKKAVEQELAELKETMQEKDEAHEAEIAKLKAKLSKSKKDNLAMIQQWQKATEDSD